jgi:hypothetical protein
MDKSALPSLRANLRTQVAFPDGYLDDPRRLSVSKRASERDLEGIIEGRKRPTSLARFAVNRGQIGRRAASNPVRVRVKPGQTRTIGKGFLIRLRGGAGSDDGASNIGLAIRLKPGERVLNKTAMRPFKGGLYLLYGPSVDQVFESAAIDESDSIATDLEAEFVAQFNRATGLTL